VRTKYIKTMSSSFFRLIFAPRRDRFKCGVPFVGGRLGGRTLHKIGRPSKSPRPRPSRDLAATCSFRKTRTRPRAPTRSSESSVRRFVFPREPYTGRGDGGGATIGRPYMVLKKSCTRCDSRTELVFRRVPGTTCVCVRDLRARVQRPVGDDHARSQ